MRNVNNNVGKFEGDINSMKESSVEAMMAFNFFIFLAFHWLHCWNRKEFLKTKQWWKPARTIYPNHGVWNVVHQRFYRWTNTRIFNHVNCSWKIPRDSFVEVKDVRVGVGVGVEKKIWNINKRRTIQWTVMKRFVEVFITRTYEFTFIMLPFFILYLTLSVGNMSIWELEPQSYCFLTVFVTFEL